MVIILPRDESYLPSIAEVALHNILWMFPFTLLPACKQLLGTRGGECRNEMLLCIMMNE